MMDDAVLRERRISSLEADVAHLKEWEGKQNGSIQRIEQKIDKLILWMMTAAVGTLGSLFVGVLIFFINQSGN